VRRLTIYSSIAWLVLACTTGKKNDQYKVERVDRGAITMTVTATGTLSAVTTVQVGSQVSGLIARLFVDFNSRVKKGQLLAQLDPTPFQQTVEQRQADLTKAKVDAANAKITYGRQARLAKAGLAAQADLDAAKTAYEGAEAQVQQATAALNQAQTNLKYTNIISPIDGIVVDRQYDVGQTVAASFQAPTLFSIAQDLTKMQVQADVDQSDIGRVQVGQTARFTVDAYPEQEFRGRIAQIRLNATVSQNVVTYPVIIEVPNPEEKLHPKMTANVTIDVAMVRDVLRVPNAALRFKPDNATTGAAGASGTQGTSQGSAGTQGSTQTTGTGGPSPERSAAAMGERRRGPGGAGAMGGWRGANGPSTAIRRSQTVWIMEDPVTKKLKGVQIRTGITDGHFTEIASGDLKVGDSVVVGLATSKVEGPPPPGSSNPMGGRQGAGGGRGR
jgi:HlyD family secretion protein